MAEARRKRASACRRLMPGRTLQLEGHEIPSLAAGYVVKDVPEGHLCCGWAGTYQVLQPELSRRLRDRKVANIESLRDPGAPAALRAAIGKDFARTARTHPMPEGATELPAIATLLGPRVPGDTTALRSLVNDRISGRYMVTPADMGYALGHDRAKAWLAADLARFPALGAGLDEARRAVAAPSPTRDLYSAWFDAVRAVAAPPGPGALPSFARTEAWADAKVNTALVGDDQDVPLAQRPEAIAVFNAPSAEAAAIGYAELAQLISGRVDPLLRVLLGSRDTDPALSDFARIIDEERWNGSAMCVRNWHAAGWLREDLSVERAADVLCALNSNEPRWLLQDRGWNAEAITAWLADSLRHALLR